MKNPNIKKIKVFEIVTRLNIGGPAVNVIYLAALLDKSKFDVKLITGKESEAEGNMFYLCEKKNVEYIFLKRLQRELDFFKDLSALIKLMILMIKFRPDIVHTHTAKAGTLGRIAAVLTFRKKIVHTFHGHIFDGYFSKTKTEFFTVIERILGKFTDKIISVSGKQRKDFVDLKIGGYDKIINIPLGLELDDFAESKKYRTAMRKKYGIADDKIVISIIARIVPIKNHILLVEAADLLKKQFGNFKVIVVGDGYLKQELNDLILKRDLTEYFEFAGFSNELEKYYGMSDIVALTSLNEGLPTVIIEAMAAGIPVVSTDVGGVSDLIKDNDTGLLVESGNPERLAEKLYLLCSNPDLRNRLGSSGRNYVLNKYTIKNLISNFEELYQNLVRF